MRHQFYSSARKSCNLEMHFGLFQIEEGEINRTRSMNYKIFLQKNSISYTVYISLLIVDGNKVTQLL